MPTIYPIDYLKYEDLFSDSPSSIEVYLRSSDKESLIKNVCYLLSIDIGSFSFPASRLLCVLFKEYPNEPIINEIKAKINKIENELGTGITLSFIDPKSIIHLLGVVLTLPNHKNNIINTFQDKLNLLKVITIANSESYHKKLVLLNNCIHSKYVSKEVALLIASKVVNYAITEYNSHEILKTQQIKFLALANFCKNSPNLKPVIDNFYKKVGVKNLATYFLTMSSVVSVWKDNKFKEGITSFKKEEFKGILNDIIPYLDSISFDATKPEECAEILKDSAANTCFKTHPLVKLSDSQYIVISDFFYSLQLYDNVRFRLSVEYNRYRAALSKEEKKNYNLNQDFNTYFTRFFSENLLFYKAVESILWPNIIRISGSDFENRGKQGRPDYYVRNKNNIFLFEYKDILFSKDLEASLNIDDLLKVVKEKLGSEKDGVGQLVHNIRDILAQRFESDNGYKADKIVVHPILIVSNRLLSIDGFSVFLNNCMNEMISHDPILQANENRIKPLIVTDIDHFILTCISSENLTNLRNLMYSYFTFLKKHAQDNLWKLYSFRNYTLNEHKLNPPTKRMFKKLTNTYMQL